MVTRPLVNFDINGSLAAKFQMIVLVKRIQIKKLRRLRLVKVTASMERLSLRTRDLNRLERSNRPRQIFELPTYQKRSNDFACKNWKIALVLTYPV